MPSLRVNSLIWVKNAPGATTGLVNFGLSRGENRAGRAPEKATDLCECA